MYPDGDLIRLAAVKAALRRDISRHRAQCFTAATRLAQPFAWLDRLLAYWRQLPPLARLAAVPLGFAVHRTLFSRLKLLGAVARWSPLVFAAARSLRSAFHRPPGPAKAARRRD